MAGSAGRCARDLAGVFRTQTRPTGQFTMAQMQKRFVQAGAIVLATSMLGGYVVYSQMAQRPGQMLPGSKTKQLSTGIDQPPAQGQIVVLQTNGQPGHTMAGSSKFIQVVQP